MTVINGGLLDGARRITAKVRDLTIDGGLPGAPLGFRLRGATQSGHPVTGTWKAGDVVPDRAGAVWICTVSGTPGTWVSAPGAASVSFKPANPAGTVSTTQVMMGLGSTLLYTPAGSGVVIVTVTAVASISAGAAGAVTVGGRYGTGAAPASGVAVTGTAFGPASDPNVRVPNVSATTGTPLTIADRLALTAGTAYWFDLAVASPVGTTTAGVISICAVLEERAS